MTEATTNKKEPAMTTAFDFNSISEVRLSSGSHENAASGMCFMEMTAWFAGEKHSDKPVCACPVLGAYGINLNDNMPDDLRDELLKPMVPLIAGTAGDLQDQIRRASFLAFWTITKILPLALRAANLDDHADACATATDLAAAYAAAARAAAYAAADAYAAREVYSLAVEGLRQAILLGRHEGFDATIDLRGRHQALRDLVSA